jgi:hypothetical protein
VARPWRRRYRLVGDPWLADPLRAELVRRGRPPGGSGATVLVLAGPLDRMLADTFTARCFETGVPPWGQWLADLARADTLAPRIDLARVARHWAGVEPGRDRVRIVSDLGRLPRRVGVRRLPVPEPLPGAPVELARRLAGVLSLLVDTATRTALLQQTLLPRLRGRPGPPLAVPDQHRDWVRARALRMQADLAAGGYPVDGRLDDLLPEPASAHRFVSGSPPHRPGGPTDESVLALAVDLLLEGAR